MFFIVIWEGFGILLVLAAGIFGIAALTWAGSLGLSPDAAFILAELLVAAALWFPGRALNDPRRDKTMVDAKTGQTVVISKRHSFFWVPVQYLAVLPLLMGLATTVDVLFDI